MPRSLKARRLLVFALIAAFSAQCLGLNSNALYLGTDTASAQNAMASQRSNSKVIPLLLQSTREENPEKAIELLKQAREELKKEGLADEDLSRILALIDMLEKKAQARLDLLKRPSAEPAPTSTHRLSETLPTIATLASTNDESNLSNETIDQALAKNPDVRDTMWEIGRSRLARDTQHLREIVKDRTGHSVEEIDQNDADAQADASKPSAFLDLLNSFDILKVDFTKANLKLKQEYSGVSLDIIADKLTRDAAKFSFPVGVLKGSMGQMGPAFRVVGVPSEVIANFLINAKLVLRIADLYGIELADSEKQIVLLSVYSALKVGAQYGTGSGNTLMSSFGQKLGQLKFGGKAGQLVEWLTKFSTNSAVAKIAGPAVTGSLVTPADTAASADPAKKRSTIRTIGARINLLGLLSAGAQGALSATETFAIGHLAKAMFKAARNEKRVIYNEEFRRFLMTPVGEGFFKLLVLSMNDGRPSLGMTQNARNHGEMKAKSDFILNLARSARICSAADLKVLREKSQSPLTPAFLYACEANPNTDRSERLRKEFLTFDAIPQDYVTDLRTVSREFRLRMAEQIIQMQFLDGDRSPSETQFFRNVIARALGTDGVQDLEYFERLHAFIQESGGLVLTNETPSGVVVRTGAPARPYDMDQGYSPKNGPEPLSELPGTRTAPLKRER